MSVFSSPTETGGLVLNNFVWMLKGWRKGNTSREELLHVTLIDILGIKVPPCLQLQPRWSRSSSAADCLCSLWQLFYSNVSPAWMVRPVKAASRPWSGLQFAHISFLFSKSLRDCSNWHGHLLGFEKYSLSVPNWGMTRSLYLCVEWHTSA